MRMYIYSTNVNEEKQTNGQHDTNQYLHAYTAYIYIYISDGAHTCIHTGEYIHAYIHTNMHKHIHAGT